MPNRSEKHENCGKSVQNDVKIVMQSQLQTRKRYQTNVNMLNTAPYKQSKQHETLMDKPEAKQLRSTTSTPWTNRQKSVQIIPNENVIIRICKKLFRKWLPVLMVSAFNETKWKPSRQVIEQQKERGGRQQKKRKNAKKQQQQQRLYTKRHTQIHLLSFLFLRKILVVEGKRKVEKNK